MTEIKILSKPDCHLCDVAKAAVQRACRGYDVNVREVDITQDRALLGRYRFHIPVVFVDGREHCRHRVDEGALGALLSAIVARRSTAPPRE